LSGDCQLISDASRRLRSSDTFTFALPRTRTRLGDRSFAVAGPQIWNSLPVDLRLVDYARFRRLLKKHNVRLRLRRLVTLCFVFGRRVQIYLLTYFTSPTNSCLITFGSAKQWFFSTVFKTISIKQLFFSYFRSIYHFQTANHGISLDYFTVSVQSDVILPELQQQLVQRRTTFHQRIVNELIE